MYSHSQGCTSSVLETATVPDARSTSTASSDYLRRCLDSWAGPIYTPPGCRTVSLCSWAGFTAVPAPTSANGMLKASDLWKDCGTTPDYNPPASERCYLGVTQPRQDSKYEQMLRAKQRRYRQRSSATSWATVSEQGEDGAKPEPTSAPLEFRKQAPKRVSTTSQLTTCLEKRTMKEEKKTFAEVMGLGAMTCSDLPSAFDSDDEED
ncbi:hypothetical protein CFE70_004216 [Pyrenophora teres f. teres 0-1]|uniref:Uncharacterized protein n=2 Tax=Pyrenophora teres f. teres TaxID=97479 RepID=E3RK37_PYRTT|nr:hypothetical protein PTT_08569 [Pyrenophora teres f. teres 0-1]KAE8833168.1 hypothetical protein HRS9139_04987 [Pyrenophora teres f. teres]KAE8841064.1 hypothetical protein PTNB85_04463 [Pyrenophora teres f. teres]KAE8848798.1 hypothetical protein HRS9122_02814 [Pyrenophora teres f. teres]KAE8864560.1 hypothetical protein PTNB29_04524 [Pyrenophora teres f. teres]